MIQEFMREWTIMKISYRYLLGLGDRLSQLELQTNFDEQSKDEISQFARTVLQDYSLQKKKS